MYNSTYLGPVYTSFDARWDAMVVAKQKIGYLNRHSAPLLLLNCTLADNAFVWGAIVTRDTTELLSTALNLTR